MINPFLFISIMLMAFILGLAIGCIIILVIVICQKPRRKTRYAYASGYLRKDISSKVRDLPDDGKRTVDGISSNDNF